MLFSENKKTFFVLIWLFLHGFAQTVKILLFSPTDRTRTRVYPTCGFAYKVGFKGGGSPSVSVYCLSDILVVTPTHLNR